MYVRHFVLLLFSLALLAQSEQVRRPQPLPVRHFTLKVIVPAPALTAQVESEPEKTAAAPDAAVVDEPRIPEKMTIEKSSAAARPSLTSGEDGETPNLSPCPWMDSYEQAMTAAERQNKMLLLYFCDTSGDGRCQRFKAETLDDPRVRRKLADYVCVALPLDAEIISKGQRVRLLEHGAFGEMLGNPGIAIIDFRSSDPNLRGAVTSVFPITSRLWYTPEHMVVILDLPPGTLTQRTLIYAVRTHPERPASTTGELNADLAAEANSHSRYQARIRTQGHQFWESRFHRIVSRLPGGLSAREVCAESWPGQNLVDAAIECVRCWRTSSGHWSAVRAPSRCFAYDMQRGANGVWYATGIFGLR